MGMLLGAWGQWEGGWGGVSLGCCLVALEPNGTAGSTEHWGIGGAGGALTVLRGSLQGIMSPLSLLHLCLPGVVQ